MAAKTLRFCCFGIFIVGSFGQRNEYRGPQTFNDYAETVHEAPKAPPSAILRHKQAVTSDGVFNYVFAADNGLKQGESISPDGTRTGAYEYIDPNGKTISVKYTAGRDGFKIIEGDHIPRQTPAVEPIDEYQPPEYRKNYKPPQAQYREESDSKYRQPQEYEPSQDEEQYVDKVIHGERPKESYGEGPKERYEERPREYEVKQRERYDEDPRGKFEERQRNNQKYTAQDYAKPKQALFNPTQQKSQYQPTYQEDSPARYQQAGFLQDYQQAGSQQAGGQKEPNRAMLYSVEQRHDNNYRKYQDNGQLVGAVAADDSKTDPGSPASPHHFNRGYNFEFSG